MRRRLPRLGFPLAVLLLAIAVAACGRTTPRVTPLGAASGTPITPAATTPLAPTPGDPTGVTWALTGMLVDGVALLVSAPGGHALTLQFRPDLGQIIGDAGCNGYGAPYTLNGDALHLKALGQTERGCGTSIETVEENYLSALLRVERFAVADGGDTLTLSSDDGGVRLTFHKA